MSPPLSSPPAHGIDAAWMVRLRWLLYAGQGALVAWMQWGLGMRLPVSVVTGLLVVGAGSNAGLWLVVRRGPALGHRALWSVMLADTLLLTALLALTGGPFNPFTALYLVHVVLAALVLPPALTWAQLAVSFTAFASLFWLQERGVLAGLTLPSHQELMRLHLAGMLVAFVVSAGVVVYFVGRVQSALRQRDGQLEAARAAAARNEKLAALTTLAAGAAHELATPLGTIAVVANELERALAAPECSDEVRDDVRLIRAEVQRCRDILKGMSASSGELRGEALTRIEVGDWLAEAREGLGEAARVTVKSSAAAGVAVKGPRTALSQALRSVLKNALEAGAGPVHLTAEARGGRVELLVEDQGAGIAAEHLPRVGEPFFTTREPGRGMGLGVFLTRAVAEALGGGFTLESAPGHGTRATLWIPQAKETPL